MPVKKHKKMEPLLVAADEYSYIAKTYKIPIKIVRATAKEISKTNKPSRSRRMIYAALRFKGYVINVKEKKKKMA